MARLLLLSFILLLSNCNTLKNTSTVNQTMNSIDIQGHRGCRGLLPENTIPAFLHALELGVHTLELDVVVTKDKVVVVSHEPFLNHEICSTLSGNEITKSDERNYNIYEMNFADLIKYDCGLQNHSKFPEQKNIPTTKPSLDEMIVASEKKSTELNRELPFYNIEIKRRKEGDLIFHPDYKEFTDLTMEVILKNKIQDRATVQCFDMEVLQYLKAAYPDQEQVFLIENRKKPEENISNLGHVPEIYSPYYKLVNKELVAYCKNKNMKLIPWTVNEAKDTEDLLALGVDGIISDYPDMVLEVVASLK